MRILVISTVSYRSNGIANVIRNLYLNEIFKNEEITFLFPDNNDSSMINEILSHGFLVLQFPRYKCGVWSYYKLVKKTVKDGHFDIVHIHGNSHAMLVELIASAISGCNIRICHSHNTTSNHVFIHKLLFPLFDLFCTDRLACGNDAGKWMYGKKKFKLINNGINTDKFRFDSESRNQIRQKFNILENDIVLGHVGNLNVQKNQTFLIDVICELIKKTPCKCFFVGEGEKRAELEFKVNKLHLERLVIFCGTTNDVSTYLSGMDIIVMPSLYEGLPLALIEEQANGLTCIVSDAITREVDKTNNVIFVSRESSAREWASIINNNLQLSNRKEKSARAIEAVRKAGYDINEEALKLLSYYKTLLL